MRNVPETHRLLRRQSVWYYRRRVPEHLVSVFGKSVLQFSLSTRGDRRHRVERQVRRGREPAEHRLPRRPWPRSMHPPCPTLASPASSGTMSSARTSGFAHGWPTILQRTRSRRLQSRPISRSAFRSSRAETIPHERIDATSERLLRSSGLLPMSWARGMPPSPSWFAALSSNSTAGASHTSATITATISSTNSSAA